MKTRLLLFWVWLLVSVDCLAASYTINLPAGNSLIANHLDHAGGNSLLNVFPPGTLSDGTEILKWNCNGYDCYYYDSTLGISPDNWYQCDQATPINVSAVTVNPGEGFFINSPFAWVLTITGTPHTPVYPPPMPCGCGKFNLVSRQTTNNPSSFTDIMGSPPPEGAILQKWNGSTLVTYTFSGGAWAPSVPSVGLGESVFVKLPCTTNNCLTISNDCVRCLQVGGYDYSFSLHNDSTQTVYYLFLSKTNGDSVFNPAITYLNPPLPPGAGTNLHVGLTAAACGQLCFWASLHLQDLSECCSRQHCIVVPDFCVPHTYSTLSDFNTGFRVNLTNSSGGLCFPSNITTFPYVNMSCSGRGTIVRIDASTGTVLAEYKTAPESDYPGSSSNPSRVSVDLDGNVWVANRNPTYVGSTAMGSVTRYALVIGGTRVNANGTINPIGLYLKGPFSYNSGAISRHTPVLGEIPGLLKTSRGLGDIRPWTGAEAGNGTVTTADDDLIINYTVVASPGTRTLAIDRNNDVWVGGIVNHFHQRLFGTTAAPDVSSGFYGAGTAGGYGGFVDGFNVLWTARGQNADLLRIGLPPGCSSGCGTDLGHDCGNYGLAIDPCSGNVWHGNAYNNLVYVRDLTGQCLNPAGYSELSPYTGVTAQGLCVDDRGNVWIAHGLSVNHNTVGHLLSASGSMVGTVTLDATNPNQGPTGVALDANGNVWVSCYQSSKARRINPNLGAYNATAGRNVGAVDLVVDLNAAGGNPASPYNYSDKTGFISLGVTRPSGFWDFIQDACADGTDWGKISWVVTANTQIKIEVRAADDALVLPSKKFVQVKNGVSFCGSGINGRHLEVRVTLFKQGCCVPTTACLQSLTVQCCQPFTPWDINGPFQIAWASPVSVSNHVALSTNLPVVVTQPGGLPIGLTWAVNGVMVQSNQLPAGGTLTQTTVPFNYTYAPGSNLVQLTAADPLHDPIFCANTVIVGDISAPKWRTNPAYTTNAFVGVVPNVVTNIHPADLSDDWADFSQITVSQSPPPGTVVTQAVTPILLVATDPSGNRSTNVAPFSILPVLTITSPDDYIVFPASTGTPVTVQIASNITDVAQVNYYLGSNLIATATNPPYTVNLTNVPQGGYDLVAEAVSTSGWKSRSDDVEIGFDAAPIGGNFSNSIIVPGNGLFSLIANEWCHGSNCNCLDLVLPNMPDGTVLVKWDCNTEDFSATQYQYSTFSHGWTPGGGTLSPGEGAFIAPPTGPLTITFTGMAEAPVLPANLPCGFNKPTCLSRQTNDIGTYETITGRLPVDGATVLRWDTTIQDFDPIFAYYAGHWYPSVPSADVSEALLITVPGSNNCLRVQCPSDIVVQACSSTPVSYSATASNACGNTDPISFTYYPPSGTSFAPGSHTVVCVASQGVGHAAVCSFTVTVTCSVPPPTIYAQPQSQTILEGGNAMFAVGANGNPPLTYQWRFNGADIASATDSFYSLYGGAKTNAGAYDVVVSNAYGVILSAPAILLVSAPQDPNGPQFQCPSNTIVYTANTIGMPVRYSVQLLSANSNLVTHGEPPSGAIFPLGTTIVNCQVSANGVTNLQTFAITVMPQDPSNAVQNLALCTITATNDPIMGLRPILVSTLVQRSTIVNWLNDEYGAFRGDTILALSNSLIQPANGYLFVGPLEKDAGLRIGSAQAIPGGWQLKFYNGDAPIGWPDGFALQSDPASVQSAGDLQFKATFVPFTTPGLAAGTVVGETGQVLDSHGSFSLGRTGNPGELLLTIPDKSGDMGQLLLNPLPASAVSPNSSDRSLMSYQYSNSEFTVTAQAVQPGSDGFIQLYYEDDFTVSFAWIDYASSATAQGGFLSSAPGMVATTGPGPSVQISWPAAANTFQVQKSHDLRPGNWANLSGPFTTTGAVTYLNVSPATADYYRLNLPLADPCVNGGFENGNFSGWRGWIGLYGSPMTTEQITPGRHTIMSGAGYDPFVGGNKMPVVYHGSYSARLGNSGINRESEALTYTFTVTPQNELFTFSYAVVLEDPGHQPSDQPYFQYRIYHGTPTSQGAVIASLVKKANSSDPYFKTDAAVSGIVYKNWDCEPAIDLSKSCQLGDVVTVEFVTADCNLGAHFGYAYIDGICEPPDASLNPSFTMPNSICEGKPLLVDATATYGESDYFWSITESDAYWNPKPGTEVSQWFLAAQAGQTNLTTWYEATGHHFKCSTYYRVKLAVKNHCVGWKELVKLLYVECGPKLDMITETNFCCCDFNQLRLGPASGALPNVVYSWSSTPPGFTSSQANPLVTITNCEIYYTVTASNRDGCVSTKSTHVRVLPDLQVTLVSQVNADCSGVTLTPKVQWLKCLACTNVPFAGSGRGDIPLTYHWNNGSNSPTITITGSTAISNSVVVSSTCNSHSASITVNPAGYLLHGPLPPIQCPNVFTPNGDGINDFWVAHDITKGVGASPAYNATKYKFEAYNRWGNLLKTITGEATSCAGFANYSIPHWDGKTSNGDDVPDGTYYYIFWLGNADTPLTDVCHGYMSIFH